MPSAVQNYNTPIDRLFSDLPWISCSTIYAWICSTSPPHAPLPLTNPHLQVSSIADDVIGLSRRSSRARSPSLTERRRFQFSLPENTEGSETEEDPNCFIEVMAVSTDFRLCILFNVVYVSLKIPFEYIWAIYVFRAFPQPKRIGGRCGVTGDGKTFCGTRGYTYMNHPQCTQPPRQRKWAWRTRIRLTVK